MTPLTACRVAMRDSLSAGLATKRSKHGRGESRATGNRESGLSVGCIAAWPMGEDFSSLVLNDLSGMGNHVDFSANLRWLDNWLGVCPKFNGTDADGTGGNEGHFDFEHTV